MAKLTRLIFMLAVATLCSLPLPAWAQSITLPPTAFEIERQKPRLDREQPLDISRKDCLEAADGRFSEGAVAEKGDFTWLVMEPAISGTIANNAFLEVWVSEGADCTSADERAANGNCSLVFLESNVARNNTLVINPRDLVARGRAKTYDADLELPESICFEPNNLVDRALSIFILFRTGSDTVDASLTWEDTSLDLAAPPPPDNISVAPGDENLFFEWEIDSQNEDQETLGFIFYCVPSGTMSSAGLGGAPGDSGEGGAAMGGGAGTESACGQTVLVDGELASAEAEKYECGRVAGRASRRGSAEDRENGTQYAVAVAAFDVVGNSGVLKVLDECLTPQEVTTFFEGYEASGGKGGGGFCAFDPRGPQGLWWLLASCGLFAFRRRKGRQA